MGLTRTKALKMELSTQTQFQTSFWPRALSSVKIVIFFLVVHGNYLPRIRRKIRTEKDTRCFKTPACPPQITGCNMASNSRMKIHPGLY
jgi:hypothetical protein